MFSKHSKKMIVIGAFLLLASLLWMVEPYYTWAQDQQDVSLKARLLTY